VAVGVAVTGAEAGAVAVAVVCSSNGSGCSSDRGSGRVRAGGSGLHQEEAAAEGVAQGTHATTLQRTPATQGNKGTHTPGVAAPKFEYCSSIQLLSVSREKDSQQR
jgi:hypothetical protein